MKNSTNKFLMTVILITVISFVSLGQTNVSGGIYANTTWTLANSPYIVVDTVVIFPNVTLTIEPGVTVKFTNNKVLEARQGKILAVGTNSDSITFTSTSLTPFPGIWDEIHINGGTLISEFEYCNFEYARSSIVNNHLNGTQNTTVELHIKHSKFLNNIIGITCTGNGGGFSKIDTTYFTNNNKSTKGAQIIFTGCTMRNNISGIFIQPFAFTYTYINSCVINSNHFGITGSATTGASFYSIKNSTIDSNSVAGIVLGGYSSYIDTILSCQIKNNPFGVLDSFGSGLLMQQSIIENNNIGLYLKGPNQYISCNKFCNNTAYNFYYNSTSSTFSAENNYWCTTDSAIISAHIYDGYDNISLGLVDFMPIDTTQCYLTGCNVSVSANVINPTCDTCYNGTATANVNNGSAPYTYTWYTLPIQATQTATGLTSGTYTICVTDANGCTACISVFVDSTNCSGFTANANANNATCITCTDGFAWVNVNGGTAPYYYTWYTSPIQTTDTATNLLHGNYFVCVTDFYGCSACDSVIVSTGNCSAHFNLYPDTVAHHYYAVNMASGISPLAYSWNWGDGSPSDTIPYPNHTYAIAGFYTICLTITDSVGCTNTYCGSYYLMRSTNTMVYVNVIPQTVIGISETLENSYVFIFPNPADDFLTCTLSQNFSTAEIKIFNLFGELEFFSVMRNDNYNIDISTLSNGIHILEITDGKNINRQKFVVQKNIR